MRQSHYSLRYVAARIRQIYHQKANPLDPWIVASAVQSIDQLVRKNDFVVEFGSGRSSVWLANRCGTLISVEHNMEWYKVVSEDLDHFVSATLYFCPLDGSEDAISNYLNPLIGAEDQSVDVVFNDGRHRDLVALAAIDKLRAGGILVIDNAERYLPNSYLVPESIGPDSQSMTASWADFSGAVSRWRRLWFSDGVCTTMILFRP